MKTSEVPQGGTRLVLVAITALVGAVLAGLVLAGSASAATPIGKDGRIHACYKVKGKQKGTLRIANGKRCRRGERKVAWLAAGGVPGPAGAPGRPGATGPSGPAADPALLEARIAALTLRLDSVCDQAALITQRANLLRGAILGLTLNGVLNALGGILNIPALPVALPDFACPGPPSGT
jgi:hypothetical protein